METGLIRFCGELNYLNILQMVVKSSLYQKAAPGKGLITVSIIDSVNAETKDKLQSKLLI